jgi:hypothetical protein
MIIIENPLKLKYKFISYEINNITINEFQTMERARILRIEKIRELKSMIINANHFDSPIIINDIQTKKRIIDGQHRLTAIKEILKENPDFVINVLLVVYQNLGRDEEKEIFTRWNSGTRQSGEDVLQIYTDDIKIYDLLKDDLSIYRENNKIRFRNVVEYYMITKEKLPSITGMDIYQFIDKAKRLDEKDAKIIKDFVKELKVNTEKDFTFKKSTGVSAITYVYFSSDKNNFWEKFNQIKSDKAIIEMGEQAGRSAVNAVVNLINNRMFGTPIPEIVPKQRVIREKKEIVVTFTPERIEWLRKNYEKTAWNREDITKEFNEKFGTNVTEGSLGFCLGKNHIKKDENFRGVIPFTYNKKVLDFIRECSKTMTASEARKKCEIKFEHEFKPVQFWATSKKNGIEFPKSKAEIQLNMNPEQIKIIKKYQNKKPYEIRDKIIEELQQDIPIKNIISELRRLKLEKQKEGKKGDKQKS